MEQIIYENDYYRVKLTHNIISLENLKGGVVILPLTESNQVVMLSIYRPAIQQLSLELPRGFKERNELSQAAAMRELLEETNIASAELISLGSVFPDSGLVNSEIELFLAKNLQAHQIVGQRVEGIKDVVFLDYSKVLQMVLDGEIKDAYTITAIVRAQKNME